MPKTVSKPNTKLILSQPIPPLFSPEKKIALFFSAKSGCTFAVKWFFFQTGFLEVAQFYSDWIHDFRINVFYKSSQYKRNLQNILNQDTKIIKVVRNPYTRVVSSYLHAIRYGYENHSLSKFFNRQIDRDNGLSFRDYLSYLETQNLWQCNVHHRVQVHAAEKRGLVTPDYIIKLENSFEDFRKVELDLNLNDSNLLNFRKSIHNTSRIEKSTFCGDRQFCLSKQPKAFPPSKNFFNQELTQKVGKLYAIDFKTYNYDQSILDLN